MKAVQSRAESELFGAGVGYDDAGEELELRSGRCLSSSLDSVLHGGHRMATYSPVYGRM